MEKEDKFELKEGAMWLSGTMKNALQEVYDHYRSVTLQNEYLRKENERLKSEAYKDEELAKMKKEYDKLSADYYRGFPISEEEQKTIAEWIKSRPEINEGAIGGRYTYQFTPTSIGVIGTITDTFTKEKFTFQEMD